MRLRLAALKHKVKKMFLWWLWRTFYGRQPAKKEVRFEERKVAFQRNAPKIWWHVKL